MRIDRNSGNKPAVRGWILLGMILAICPWMTPEVRGQADVSSARLAGSITDQSGAAITEAVLTVRSIERGSARIAKTDDRGNYYIPLLQPGLYELNASAPGFQTQTVRPITLTIGQSAVYDLQLSVSGASEESTTTIEAPIVEVERTQQADTVERRQIEFKGRAGLPPSSPLAFVSGDVPRQFQFGLKLQF